MSDPNQPPGGAFGPPGGAFGQPQQPQQGAFGQPQQGAFGPQPQQGAFGAQPQQGAFGAQPQQGAFGAQQGAFGAQPQQGAFGGQPQGAFGGMSPAPGFGQPQTMVQGPPRKLGLFEKIPCPHCGAQMSSSAGHGATAGRFVGGLFGWMIVTAIASKYYCPTHGEVPLDRLPKEHHSMVTMRRLAMIGGALGIIFLAFSCLIFANTFRYY